MQQWRAFPALVASSLACLGRLWGDQ